MPGGKMTERSRLIIDVMCNVLEVLFNLMLKFATPFSSADKELKIRPFASDGRYIYFGTSGDLTDIVDQRDRDYCIATL